jgi:endonuclease YncB( thermonuclease family)
VRALDGDSLEARLPGGRLERVRLRSVDAPEAGQPLAEEAKRFTHRRIAGRELRLVTGRVARDRYGRLLARVEVEDRSVNEALVAAGLALAYLGPADAEDADRLLAAQARAHDRRLGLWGAGGPYEEPRSLRERERGERDEPRLVLDENWTVVGNRRSRVAHWPGCRHVDEIAPHNRVALESLAEAGRLGFRMEGGYR